MKILCGLLIFATITPAQQFGKHNFNVDLGAALPRGELKYLFSDSFLAGFGYGYRFHEFFQLDVGFDTAFGAADVDDFLPSIVGNLRIRDYQHFVPFGGRAILPLARDRIHIYGGGGGVYLHYSERIRQPLSQSGLILECDVCSSRNGFGYYALVGVDVAVDRFRRFRVGVGYRIIRGETDGDPFGSVPPRPTTDRWVNLFGRFTFTF